MAAATAQGGCDDAAAAANGAAALREVGKDDQRLHRHARVVGTPAGRRRGALIRQGSDFGPPATGISEFPPDVIETLEVLVEIELSRQCRLLRGASPVEREVRSPAQAEVTGTMQRSKAMKSLDASEATRDDAVLT